MNVDADRRGSPEPLNRGFFERNGGRVTERHFDRIIDKARAIEGKVAGVPALQALWQDVLSCLELIRDYRSGAYRDIATWAIAAMAFGLLYLINPAELIPDVIPVVGYLDDVAVMVLILKLVRVELDKYVAWRKACEEKKVTLAELADRE